MSENDVDEVVIPLPKGMTVHPLVARSTATITDVDGHWILDWPDELDRVEISYEVMAAIVKDHNDRVRP